MKVMDLFKAWQGSNNWARIEDSKECRKCRDVYMTGDVVLVFAPSILNLMASEYYCTACGFKRLTEKNEWPAGVSIFVQQEHKGSELELMPEYFQERLVEACAIVDQLFKNIEAVASEGKTVSTGNAREQLQKAEETGEKIPPSWRLN